MAAATGCADRTRTIDVCARGDRDVIAANVTSIELTFLDGNDVPLGTPIEVEAHGSHIDPSTPAGTTRIRATGFDAGGAPIARGEAVLSSSGACICFALDAQAPAVCNAVTCEVADHSCRFYGGDGTALGAQTVGFGEQGDVTKVTTDTFLESDAQTTTHDTAIVEAGPSPTRVGLFRFEIAAIPKTAIVDAAALVLHVCAAAGCDTTHPFELRPVLEAWTEQATWLERMPGTAWAVAGCAGPPSCSAASVGSIATAPVDATLTIAIDPAQVQAWVAAPTTNAGLALLRASTTGTAGHFDSSESATPPRLDVTFHLE